MVFNLNELLQTVIYAIITAVVPVLTTYLVQYLKSLRDKKLADIHNELVALAIDRATDIIFKEVDRVSQTFVDTLKKQDKFDEASQKQAFKMVLENTKALLNEDSKALLSSVYNDLDKFIGTVAESYIKIRKE